MMSLPFLSFSTTSPVRGMVVCAGISALLAAVMLVVAMHALWLSLPSPSPAPTERQGDRVVQPTPSVLTERKEDGVSLLPPLESCKDEEKQKDGESQPTPSAPTECKEDGVSLLPPPESCKDGEKQRDGATQPTPSERKGVLSCVKSYKVEAVEICTKQTAVGKDGAKGATAQKCSVVLRPVEQRC